MFLHEFFNFLVVRVTNSGKRYEEHCYM